MGKKTIAAYCRTATADDMAIETQKASLAEYAKNHTNSEVVYYVDNGHSGLDYNRPALSKLNQDISDGKVDAVIISGLSQIGRNLRDTLKWVDETQKQGVPVITMGTPMEFHDELMLIFKEVLE